MNKQKLLVIFFLAIGILWTSSSIIAQSQEPVQLQKSHDSASIMERRKRKIEFSQKRKEAAKRFRESGQGKPSSQLKVSKEEMTMPVPAGIPHYF
ncbi:hypothetical protein HY745_00645 [Candidatus Desantisbacteria bacterium]|nr:hypothetical protein [Candidatus Desantisbacteria bacterium]